MLSTLHTANQAMILLYFIKRSWIHVLKIIDDDDDDDDDDDADVDDDDDDLLLLSHETPVKFTTKGQTLQTTNHNKDF